MPDCPQGDAQAITARMSQQTAHLGRKLGAGVVADHPDRQEPQQALVSQQGHGRGFHVDQVGAMQLAQAGLLGRVGNQPVDCEQAAIRPLTPRKLGIDASIAMRLPSRSITWWGITRSLAQEPDRVPPRSPRR